MTYRRARLNLKRFVKAAGVKPNLITYFRNFGKEFDASDACMATGQGALPFIQIEPFRPYTVSSIANGHWDSYLKSYAAAVKAFRARIAGRRRVQAGGAVLPQPAALARRR